MQNVPNKILNDELAYVASSSNWLVRAYRAARAAWRCARIAAKAGAS